MTANPAFAPVGEIACADFADKLTCAERELAMRRRIYPGRVAAGRMTQASADHEIATMAAIVADYAFWGRGLTSAEYAAFAEGRSALQPAEPHTAGQARARAAGELAL